jgi:hypothetical protein
MFIMHHHTWEPTKFLSREEWGDSQKFFLQTYVSRLRVVSRIVLVLYSMEDYVAPTAPLASDMLLMTVICI